MATLPGKDRRGGRTRRVLGAMLLLPLVVAMILLDEPPFSGGSEPGFTPTIDPELYEIDLDESDVVDGVVNDDDWMIDVHVEVPALNDFDAERLQEFQPYPEIDQILDP